METWGTCSELDPSPVLPQSKCNNHAFDRNPLNHGNSPAFVIGPILEANPWGNAGEGRKAARGRSTDPRPAPEEPPAAFRTQSSVPD